MKKIIKYIITGLILVGIVSFIIYVFKEATPYEENNKLHIKCGGNHTSLEVYLDEKFTIFENDPKCKLSFKVKNIERTYIKINSDDYFYRLRSDGRVDDTGTYTDVIVEPSSSVVMYGKDKTTKFEFQYK